MYVLKEIDLAGKNNQVCVPIGLCSRYTQVSLGRLRRGSRAAKESNPLPEQSKVKLSKA